MVFGTHCCGAMVKVGHYLVVAVHEVYLEALDAHFAIVLAHTLHVAVESIVAGPEYNANIAFCGILYQHGQVDFRHHLEQVGLLVDSPALVKNDIFNAVA